MKRIDCLGFTTAEATAHRADHSEDRERSYIAFKSYIRNTVTMHVPAEGLVQDRMFGSKRGSRDNEKCSLHGIGLAGFKPPISIPSRV